MKLLTLRNVKIAIQRPTLAYRYVKSIINQDEKKFISAIFDNENEFLGYKKELEESGILDLLDKKHQEFENKVRGKSKRGHVQRFGQVSKKEGTRLYSLIRKFKPKVLVETGVCNGTSTTYILSALHKNNKGKLYSIDFPEFEGTEYEKEIFWEGKGGAVIPKDKQPGWIIPKHLRKNWKLLLGKSQEKLPQLLKKLGKIDFFMHDSEHSYECMWFEFNEAFNKLTKGGILMSDDVYFNSSFYDFAKKHNKRVIKGGAGLGIIIK